MASSDTQYKKGKNHPYFGKSSPALGKHWTLSAETRKKMSKAQKGKRHPWITEQLTGTKIPSNSNELHPDWKGDEVSYRNLHRWVERKRGKPQKCEHCGTSEKRRYHWANKSRKYKRDLDDWFRLCIPCHKKYDHK